MGLRIVFGVALFCCVYQSNAGTIHIGRRQSSPERKHQLARCLLNPADCNATGSRAFMKKLRILLAHTRANFTVPTNIDRTERFSITFHPMFFTCDYKSEINRRRIKCRLGSSDASKIRHLHLRGNVISAALYVDINPACSGTLHRHPMRRAKIAVKEGPEETDVGEIESPRFGCSFNGTVSFNFSSYVPAFGDGESLFQLTTKVGGHVQDPFANIAYRGSILDAQSFRDPMMYVGELIPHGVYPSYLRRHDTTTRTEHIDISS